MLPTPQESLHNISVILVRTASAGNIGSTARIMGNMGLRRLKLVEPRASCDDEARRMATSAHAILDQASRFSSLRQAVAQEHALFGTTSGRERRHSQPVLSPRQAAQQIVRLAGNHRVGLVFGPERTGMTANQLARCQTLIRIPTDDAYPVLNVSKAVAVICYEISQCGNTSEAAPEPLIEVLEREEIYRRIQELLIRVGFLSQSNPTHIMNALRNILDQSELTPRDGQILRGILSQVEWCLERGVQLDPKEILKP